jgi:hypothetical protein
MKNLLLTGITALILCGELDLHAQNTNGWPLTQPLNATQFNSSQGTAAPLNSVSLAPASTNTYAVGSINQIFIPTVNNYSVGLQFASVIPTNTSAPYTTNLTGNLTLRISKTVDGVTAESTPSIVLVLNSSGNTYAVGGSPPLQPASLFTNIVVSGYAGLFISTLESTNTGTYGPTNVVTLKVLNQVVQPPVDPYSQLTH